MRDPQTTELDLWRRGLGACAVGDNSKNLLFAKDNKQERRLYYHCKVCAFKVSSLRSRTLRANPVRAIRLPTPPPVRIGFPVQRLAAGGVGQPGCVHAQRDALGIVSESARALRTTSRIASDPTSQTHLTVDGPRQCGRLRHALLMRLLLPPACWLGCTSSALLLALPLCAGLRSERTAIITDVITDPTLPRTRETECPNCGNKEAVFFQVSTENEGCCLCNWSVGEAGAGATTDRPREPEQTILRLDGSVSMRLSLTYGNARRGCFVFSPTLCVRV